MEELIELAPPEERYRFSAAILFFYKLAEFLLPQNGNSNGSRNGTVQKTGLAKILFSDRTSYSAFQSPSELAEPQNVPRPMSP